MLLAIEGIDGSGKATQVRLLSDRCRAEGLTCFRFAFPQYGKNPFAEAISDYLNGRFGGVRDVHPKLASMLYAADRYSARTALKEAIEKHDLVVCDRYVASNMAHQAAKLPEADREALIQWLAAIEYGEFALPKADLTILLDVPEAKSSELVHQKGDRTMGVAVSEGEQQGYTSLRADIHEADLDYLAACRTVYAWLAGSNLGGDWRQVPCLDIQGMMRSPADIADDVWHHARSAGLSP